MHAYRVGQLYSTKKTSWPESGQFNHRAGANELVLFYRRPDAEEIRDVRQGEAEFALLIKGDIICLLYRFGNAIPWSDAPYSWHLVKKTYPDQATIPEPANVPEPHDTLQVILVDAGNGVIKALRLLTFSPAFSTALRLAIREQANRPWPGDAAYDRQLAVLYGMYPNSKLMIKDATARTKGGA